MDLLPVSIILIGGSLFSIVALKFSKIYIWLYLISTSHFLGLFRRESFEIEGVFNLSVMFFIGAFGASVLKLINGRRLPPYVRALTITSGALFTFGILYPVFNGFSDFTAAFIDGKEMFAYVFLPYLVLHHSSGLRVEVNRAIRFVGFILAVEVLMATFFGITTEGNPPIEPELGVDAGIHVYSGVYIYLGFLLHWLSRHRFPANQQPFWFLCSGIYFLGLLYEGHRSIFLGFLFVFVAVFILKRNTKLILQCSAIGIAAALFLLLELDLFNLEQTLIQPIEELLFQRGAIASRSHINFFRFSAIQESPLWGYGFIDERSSLGKEMLQAGSTVFDQTFSTIDSGYVDMNIRFGLIGTAVFVSCFGWVLYRLIRRSMAQKNLNQEKIVLFAFLISFYAIAITWSVFTYQFGIFSLSAAIYLLVRPKRRKRIQPQTSPVPPHGKSPNATT